VGVLAKPVNAVADFLGEFVGRFPSRAVVDADALAAAVGGAFLRLRAVIGRPLPGVVSEREGMRQARLMVREARRRVRRRS
jgi:hypothetical protein